MRTFIYSFLIVFVLAGCSEKKKPVPAPAAGYTSEVLGTTDGAKHTLLNTDDIRRHWQKVVKGMLMAKDNVELTGFEIRKTKTQGDAVQDCYLLAAQTEDGFIKVAALVELKDGKFYFEDPEDYKLMICQGECTGGCVPVAQVNGGKKSLICSPCLSCEKIGIDIENNFKN